MFKALNYALHRKVNPPLPPHDDDTKLANDFSDFFDEKISKIRSELDRSSPGLLMKVILSMVLN